MHFAAIIDMDSSSDCWLTRQLIGESFALLTRWDHEKFGFQRTI